MPSSKRKKQKKNEGGGTTESLVPEIVIQNVVSTFYLGRKKINLKEICSRLKYLEFNPHKFAAATLRLKAPRTTQLIFGSGNVVCTGGKSIKDSCLACRYCVNIFQRSGLRVGFYDFKIQNVVGSTGIDDPIDLMKLKNDFSVYTSYEPELFPGLIFRLSAPKVVYLLFRSGRIVVTGAKTEAQLKKYWDTFFKYVLINYIDFKSNLKCSSEYRFRNTKKDYGCSYFYEALK
tara:strand:+ start:542 stop:1237 length:696 start_codon:yes stop_codon:yes gene_type:complete